MRPTLQDDEMYMNTIFDRLGNSHSGGMMNEFHYHGLISGVIYFNRKQWLQIFLEFSG